jgi:hypothetical protein
MQYKVIVLATMFELTNIVLAYEGYTKSGIYVPANPPKIGFRSLLQERSFFSLENNNQLTK